MCENVCPEINGLPQRQPLHTFAVVNPNRQILKISSSGGVFTYLAEKILADDGVVFGAAFDVDWSVHHIAITTIEELSLLRGSKYLQSRIEDSYREAEMYLKTGRKVMFTGTSCQIEGLRLFLRKEYANLLAVECLCHGVPSPLVWQKYLRQTIGDKQIANISFRDKYTGWENYSFRIKMAEGEEFTELSRNNAYMKGFLSNIFLRPSCEQCPSKEGRSGSDILLADYWGVKFLHPEYYDKGGTGLVMTFTMKGEEMMKGIPCHSVALEEAKKYNAGFSCRAHRHKKRAQFFEKLEKEDIESLIRKYCRVSFLSRIEKKVINLKIKIRNKVK
ncbi:Coenzyme F420 hydrogenase/dehydrogenase, beta subunit C-terminal domain [Prevotella dentasini JCM 15908]